MKSTSDYYKKVLGLSLKGSKEARKKAESKEPQNLGAFCFLCEKEDFEAHKTLVLKILSAAQQTEEIIVHEAFGAESFKETFSFFGGSGEAQDFKVKFPKFSELSKSPELKKKLWDELKKRI
jgi:hypothetical protein